MPERRIPELPASFELAGEKAWDVVIGGERDRARVGLERLDEHAPRCVAAASSRELRQQLERSLLRPEVGKTEAGVRVDDGRERDAGKVVTLRDHLRADEDGAVGGGEA